MQGILYNQGDLAGELDFSNLLKYLRILARGMRMVGKVFIALGAVGIVYIYGPLVREEAKYEISKSEFLNPKQIQKINEQKEIVNDEYLIKIPKIGAESKVISDVDAFDPKAYGEALKLGVAEASGLSHPGELGTTYLFAHSVASRVDFARYNAVFYLLNKLESGDEVEINYHGQVLKYEVIGREVLKATDTKYILSQNLVERLVLQTCYPPGTTWKRLVVVAKRV
ncbi:MAG: sortase [Patescibacteria group bacterium]